MQTRISLINASTLIGHWATIQDHLWRYSDRGHRHYIIRSRWAFEVAIIHPIKWILILLFKKLVDHNWWNRRILDFPSSLITFIAIQTMLLSHLQKSGAFFLRHLNHFPSSGLVNPRPFEMCYDCLNSSSSITVG